MSECNCPKYNFTGKATGTKTLPTVEEIQSAIQSWRGRGHRPVCSSDEDGQERRCAAICYRVHRRDTWLGAQL